VTSPASAGCHRLIQEFGAACVTSAAEMAELAGIATDAGDPSDAEFAGSRSSAGNDEGVRVLDSLSYRAQRSVREVAVRSGMSERETRSVLATLELERLVVERDGSWIKQRE